VAGAEGSARNMVYADMECVAMHLKCTLLNLCNKIYYTTSIILDAIIGIVVVLISYIVIFALCIVLQKHVFMKLKMNENVQN
jgi:hypothetical protein